MRLMMPPRAGRGWGAEGGGGASSWVVCGVGATAWASPQTAVAALGGVGSASGGKSGAPTSAHCGRRREVRRSRPFSALAHAHIAARSWLIVSDQAIPHRLTVAHFGFRPPAWCRSTPPSQQLASYLCSKRALFAHLVQEYTSCSTGLHSSFRSYRASPPSVSNSGGELRGIQLDYSECSKN